MCLAYSPTELHPQPCDFLFSQFPQSTPDFNSNHAVTSTAHPLPQGPTSWVPPGLSQY
jgi:hypothetical protein